jgi:hypothetical protein
MKNIDGNKMLKDALKQIKTIDEFVRWACLFINGFPKIKVRKNKYNFYEGCNKKDKERMKQLYNDTMIASGNLEGNKIMFEVVEC